MYKKGLLFELHQSVKDAMEPVQHGTYKSKRIKDAKGNSTGVSEDDPDRTRNKAAKSIVAKIEKAAKKGKKVVYRVEGRDKKNKAGDRAMERLAAYAAKKHGAGYEEKSLERPTKAGGKKAQKAGKSYDPKKGNYRAHPADDPSGKTKSNKTSRGVKKWNKGRQDGFRSNVKADKKAGHETVGTLGAGHWNLDEKRRHPRNEAERVLRQQDRHQRGVRRAEQLRGLEAAGGTNAPKGHTRKAGNALQRLNQKQDSKAGKENTRVRHVKNHIMMGIRDKDGQLTPKAAKTYVAHRKANLQRKREKRQFNQSMGTE